MQSVNRGYQRVFFNLKLSKIFYSFSVKILTPKFGPRTGGSIHFFFHSDSGTYTSLPLLWCFNVRHFSPLCYTYVTGQFFLYCFVPTHQGHFSDDRTKTAFNAITYRRSVGFYRNGSSTDIPQDLIKILIYFMGEINR